jgi:hypothetical protein
MADEVERLFGELRVTRVDWPIVLTEFPVKRVQDAELAGMFAYLEELLHEAEQRRERLFFITDLTCMREIAPANQRKQAAQFMERTSVLAKAASVGAAQVTPSAILRGIFTAVFWIHPSPMPSIFVATRKEAMVRGVGMLQAAGALLPPRLTALREVSRSVAR